MPQTLETGGARAAVGGADGRVEGKVRVKVPELPTFYYLDHFREMLAFVESTYASVLEAEHRAFIEQFRGLGTDEQSLFVRLSNRRGDVFCASHLRYAEINDVARAIVGLTQQGFLRTLAETDYFA